MEEKRYNVTTINETVQENVKRLRKANKWSQGKLAGKAEISYSYISVIEREIKDVQTTTLAAIANAFGITLDELCTRYVHIEDEPSQAS